MKGLIPFMRFRNNNVMIILLRDQIIDKVFVEMRHIACADEGIRMACIKQSGINAAQGPFSLVNVGYHSRVDKFKIR